MHIQQSKFLLVTKRPFHIDSHILCVVDGLYAQPKMPKIISVERVHQVVNERRNPSDNFMSGTRGKVRERGKEREERER